MTKKETKQDYIVYTDGGFSASIIKDNFQENFLIKNCHPPGKITY